MIQKYQRRIEKHLTKPKETGPTIYASIRSKAAQPVANPRDKSKGKKGSEKRLKSVKKGRNSMAACGSVPQFQTLPNYRL